MSPGSRNSGTPSMITSPRAAIARPTTTRVLPKIFHSAKSLALPCRLDQRAPCRLDQIDAGEEVADLIRCRLRRVGSVRGVALDRLRELLAQRAGIRLGGVGRAHQRPPFLDRVGR